MAAACSSRTFLDVRLAKLLIGRDLVFRVVVDQGLEPALPFIGITLAQALDRQSVAEEGVGRVLGEALLELQAAG